MHKLVLVDDDFVLACRKSSPIAFHKEIVSVA